MKKKVSYTVDDNVLEIFNQKTKKLAINKSALIENLIKEWLRAEKEKEKAIQKWVEEDVQE